MMTASQFKKRSSIFLHRRSSPIIKDLDTLMKALEQPSTSPNRRLKCLVYIYMVSKQYLVAKPNGRRGDAIGDLLDEVRDELDSRATRDQIMRKVAGEGYSNGRKVDRMDGGGNVMTSLDAPYVYEAILPQRNFVEKMGLNLESILSDNNRYYGISSVSSAIETQQGLDAKQAADMISKMPLSKVLDVLHDMWQLKDNLGTFNYLNGEQRLQYLVAVKQGMLFNYQTDAPLHCAYPVPYAIDLNERLFALHDAKAIGISWNHSSMLSGAPVICAGEFTVRNGRLEMLDNNSGHYKPGLDNLVDAVKILGQQGIDLRGFRAEDKSRGTKYATAQALLNAARGGGVVRQ